MLGWLSQPDFILPTMHVYIGTKSKIIVLRQIIWYSLCHESEMSHLTIYCVDSAYTGT